MDLNYAFAVAGGSTFIPNDYGLVSVIDGCMAFLSQFRISLLMYSGNLKVTPLRKANVPPPMSFYEIPLKYNAIDTASSRDGTRIAILNQQQLIELRFDSKASAYSERSCHSIPIGPIGRILPRQIAFQGDSDVAVLVHLVDSHRDVIYKATLDTDVVFSTLSLDLPFACTSLVSGLDYNSTFIESADGSIYRLESGQMIPNGTNDSNGTTTDKCNISIKEVLRNPPWPRPCPRIEVWQSNEKVRRTLTIRCSFSRASLTFPTEDNIWLDRKWIVIRFWFIDQAARKPACSQLYLFPCD